MFFADLRGHPEEEPVARALKALEERCTYARLLGAYPEASAEVSPG